MVGGGSSGLVSVDGRPLGAGAARSHPGGDGAQPRAVIRDRPNKVLWVGDAGCYSGFATATHGIADRLQRDFGWDIHVLATNYRGDPWPTNLTLYPATLESPMDIHGRERLLKLVAQLMPNVIVFLNDPFIVRNTLLFNGADPEQVLWRGYALPGGEFHYKPPIVAYLPIDGYDSPRSWDVLKDRVTRVAMSDFGQQAMPEAPVVWHGVDPTIYRPFDKRDAKRALGFDPDRFLILRVDKNSFRKDYPSTWKALRPLLRRYSDIDVHFHCQPVAGDGYDLNELRFNDEDIRDRLTFTNERGDLGGFVGWPEKQLAVLQAAADVFVTTSQGEGWGLAIGQSLACGTPVVATDCSAISEVVGPGGILVPPSHRISAPRGQEHCVADIDGFTAAIESLYTSRRRRRELAEAGLAHIKRADWDVAARQFNEILTGAIDGVATKPTPVLAPV